MRVRGIGRRSANPPYSTFWATLLAAATTWSGFGIRSTASTSTGENYPSLRGLRVPVLTLHRCDGVEQRCTARAGQSAPGVRTSLPCVPTSDSSVMKEAAHAFTSCWVTCLRIAFIRRATSLSSAR